MHQETSHWIALILIKFETKAYLQITQRVDFNINRPLCMPKERSEVNGK